MDRFVELQPAGQVIIVRRQPFQMRVAVIDALQQISRQDRTFRADRYEMIAVTKLHNSTRVKTRSIWNNIVMATATISTITALQAQATANYFLLTQLGDRMVANDPTLDSVKGGLERARLAFLPIHRPHRWSRRNISQHDNRKHRVAHSA